MVPNITIDEVDRNVTIPIENISGKTLTLKKGRQIAEMNKIEALDIEINSTCSPYESLLNLNELRVGKMNNTEQEKLFQLVKNYDFNIKTTSINNEKIPL